MTFCWIPPPLPVTVMGKSPASRGASHRDGHRRAARAGRRNRFWVEAYGHARGQPEAERLMELLKPPLIVVVIVDVP